MQRSTSGADAPGLLSHQFSQQAQQLPKTEPDQDTNMEDAEDAGDAEDAEDAEDDKSRVTVSRLSDFNGEVSRPDMPRPYKCPMCTKAFHRLEHQTRHIRTHTGEKPHACVHAGCTKKFSRSDELTRHIRIHVNPNARRSNRVLHATTQERPIMLPTHHHHHQYSTGRNITRSAPVSQVVSPNVSPPHSYGAHAAHHPSNLNPRSRLPQSNSGLDMNLLANAAYQVERDSHPVPSHQAHPRYYPPVSSAHYPAPPGSLRLPSLMGYVPSNSHPILPRSHSSSDNSDSTQLHLRRRSRPASPHSTAPSSPTFSHGSFSPTPDHTPLATPAQSPRIFAKHAGSNMQLPPLGDLSLRPPHLPPMQPLPTMAIKDPFSGRSSSSISLSALSTRSSSSDAARFGEMNERSDTAHRQLPMPVPQVFINEAGRY